MTAVTQRQVNIGLQGEVGTAVNVDVTLFATCSLKPAVTKVIPEENVGSLAPIRHYISQVKGEGALKMDATYEQIVYPIWMALGAVTPTTGNGDPYTWAWTLPYQTSLVSTIEPFTLEYIDAAPQGLAAPYVVRLTDTFATALTISGSAPEGWQVEAELAGRALDFPADLSADPTFLETVTPIKMAETTLQVDALFANIGDTTVEELISFNWKLEDHFHEKQFAGSLYPNGWGAGRWKTTLELTLEVSAAEAQTFAEAVLTTTLYAVRIKGYVDANDSCNIDGMYMVNEVSTLDDRDGNNIIKVTLLGQKDTLDNTGAITVICATDDA